MRNILLRSLCRKLSIPALLASCIAVSGSANGAVCPESSLGVTLLVVDGDIGAGARDCRVSIDLEWLESLPQVSFATSTPWTKGVLVFTGPTLTSVLQSLQAGPGDIVGHAANQYSATITRYYIADDAPIIATRIDGRPFSLRENGPLWIIYPFDRQARYPLDEVMRQSIWQLESLTVLHADVQ
jgi:hypothetical protein